MMNQSELTSSFCRADDWQKFVQYLRHNNRFALTDYWKTFLDLVIDTSKKRRTRIPQGSKFFRARKGLTWIEDEFGNEGPAPYSKRRWVRRQRDLQKKED